MCCTMTLGAPRRARLTLTREPATRIERKAFPSMGQMLADQIGGFTAEEADRVSEHKNTHELY